MRGQAPPRTTSRRRSAVRAATAAAAAVALLPVFTAAQPATAGQPSSGALQRAFADASRRYQVPQSVLMGVAYLESRWDGHGGAPSVSGGYGPMHLTDLRTAIADSPAAKLPAEAQGDPRGDTSRPMKATAEPAGAPATFPASSLTARRAATLTGLSESAIRQNAADNVAGGAALLAADQKALGHPLDADPADWSGAVARYSGAATTAAAADFTGDVFQTIRDGEARTTDAGQRVVLAARPGTEPRSAQLTALGLPAADTANTECPPTVACSWVPAPYEQYGTDPTDYGNHDLADRPQDSSIDYIVIHDTEATWDTTMGLVQDPTYLGWHYTVKSSDGEIAQHMATKDVGWHAGNWYINSKSIGVEHEGFLADPDAWYTESMYRDSARLVRYLADRYHIPLDRQHILGHDNVPGTTPSTVASMHTDPGPYWDWAHYFQLLGAPIHPTAGPDAKVVTIDPAYQSNQPAYTGCVTAGQACAPHGSTAIHLYTAPSTSAPLVKDIGLHTTGGDSTIDVNDTGARASTGQQYVVAGRQGDWTAIWYLGQEAWFESPAHQPVAVGAQGMVATPRPGLTSVPVYGRAYPEASAYPANVPVQAQTPLQYTLPAGQSYVVGGRTLGEYFYSTTFDTSQQAWVKGKEAYYEIQFGQRVAYVKASDVVLHHA
ncbi:N-acetylmuramoyl-L-alanine amidase [Streptantibioticus silvisoli]|jgi:N-acetyl-anhydromuramyl-L-alanine amidase AmpD|uniref:N-acetylmuramoyl-L-alanine amidase n=1 Tax=Streptantibioticus silvisoli TaxID=2705255 RepID=A0ABT6W5F3_9ACTN|nr:peptidoglycan recognition family protein [Streptantibioticus silvisoli]MDI5965605.1 peptidoglycan recognition family protein [Streptantibioticus silvisoli]